MNPSIAGNPKAKPIEGEKYHFTPFTPTATSNSQQKLLQFGNKTLTNPSIFGVALPKEIPNLAKQGTKTAF